MNDCKRKKATKWRLYAGKKYRDGMCVVTDDMAETDNVAFDRSVSSVNMVFKMIYFLQLTFSVVVI